MHEILTKCYDSPSEEFDARIIDGPFFVHFFGPFANQTFQQYMAKMHRTLLGFFKNSSRIDLVFDVYLDDSLKAATRAKRGRGLRRHVTAETNQINHQINHQIELIFIEIVETRRSFFIT